MGLVASIIITLYTGIGYYILKPNLPQKIRVTTNCTNPSKRNITLPPPRAPLYVVSSVYLSILNTFNIRRLFVQNVLIICRQKWTPVESGTSRFMSYPIYTTACWRWLLRLCSASEHQPVAVRYSISSYVN